MGLHTEMYRLALGKEHEDNTTTGKTGHAQWISLALACLRRINGRRGPRNSGDTLTDYNRGVNYKFTHKLASFVKL